MILYYPQGSCLLDRHFQILPRFQDLGTDPIICHCKFLPRVRERDDERQLESHFSFLLSFPSLRGFKELFYPSHSRAVVIHVKSVVLRWTVVRDGPHRSGKGSRVTVSTEEFCCA